MTQKDISRPELYLYFTVWTGAVFYSVYSFYGQSKNFFQYYQDDYADLLPGWPSLDNRKKDVADYEWETIKYLLQKLYLWLFMHCLGSEILRKLNLTKILALWQILLPLSIIYNELGLTPFLMTLFQPLAFLLIINPKRRSKTYIWTFNSIVLLLISMFKSIGGAVGNEKLLFILIPIIFWMNLKCVSYHLDLASIRQDSDILGFLQYCFYLPTVFCGPFLSYQDFRNTAQAMPSLTDRFTQLILGLIRFYFWTVFTEFFLHYLYINAIGFHPEWVKTLNPWSLYGYGYAMGQFFHLKYVILYGFSTAFCKFDNIKAPSLPICIGRVHLYSDMWKYFDVGLYNFLLRYIYIPLLNRKIIGSQLSASLATFFFVYIWHGFDDYILTWTILNYFGILIEHLAKQFIDEAKLKRTFGVKWCRRFMCLAASPLLGLSAISNFYFFARQDVGNVFLWHYLDLNHLKSNLILIGILYCCCQVSTEFRRKRK